MSALSLLIFLVGSRKLLFLFFGPNLICCFLFLLQYWPLVPLVPLPLPLVRSFPDICMWHLMHWLNYVDFFSYWPISGLSREQKRWRKKKLNAWLLSCRHSFPYFCIIYFMSCFFLKIVIPCLCLNTVESGDHLSWSFGLEIDCSSDFPFLTSALLKEETRDPHLTSSAGRMQSIFSGCGASKSCHGS